MAPVQSFIKIGDGVNGQTNRTNLRNHHVLDTQGLYKSAELQITKHAIQGGVMKAIQNVSVFHNKDYHKRFFKVDFQSDNIKYYDSEKMDPKKLK